MRHGEFPIISWKGVTDLSVLKDCVLQSDEIVVMTKKEQEEVYRYCRLYATYPACLENLRQIRYAVTKIYFGW